MLRKLRKKNIQKTLIKMGNLDNLDTLKMIQNGGLLPSKPHRTTSYCLVS